MEFLMTGGFRMFATPSHSTFSRYQCTTDLQFLEGSAVSVNCACNDLLLKGGHNWSERAKGSACRSRHGTFLPTSKRRLISAIFPSCSWLFCGLLPETADSKQTLPTTRVFVPAHESSSHLLSLYSQPCPDAVLNDYVSLSIRIHHCTAISPSSRKDLSHYCLGSTCNRSRASSSKQLDECKHHSGARGIKNLKQHAS